MELLSRAFGAVSKNIREILCLSSAVSPASPADCTSRLMIPLQRRLKSIEPRTISELCAMSTNRATDGKESEKMNVLPEELHFPQSHPQREKIMNMALNYCMYDVISCTSKLLLSHFITEKKKT